MANKQVTWSEMIDIAESAIAPFSAQFTLYNAVDENGDVAFGPSIVIEMVAKNPRVEADGEEFFAVDAESIFCEVL